MFALVPSVWTEVTRTRAWPAAIWCQQERSRSRNAAGHAAAARRDDRLPDRRTAGPGPPRRSSPRPPGSRAVPSCTTSRPRPALVTGRRRAPHPARGPTSARPRRRPAPRGVDAPDRTERVVDLLAASFTGPLFTAALEVWVAARTDAELRDALDAAGGHDRPGAATGSPSTCSAPTTRAPGYARPSRPTLELDARLSASPTCSATTRTRRRYPPSRRGLRHLDSVAPRHRRHATASDRPTAGVAPCLTSLDAARRPGRRVRRPRRARGGAARRTLGAADSRPPAGRSRTRSPTWPGPITSRTCPPPTPTRSPRRSPPALSDAGRLRRPGRRASWHAAPELLARWRAGAPAASAGALRRGRPTDQDPVVRRRRCRRCRWRPAGSWRPGRTGRTSRTRSVSRPDPTARLRHVVHLANRTIGFSFAAHGRAVPDAPVRLELTAPDGARGRTGPDDADERGHRAGAGLLPRRDASAAP